MSDCGDVPGGGGGRGVGGVVVAGAKDVWFAGFGKGRGRHFLQSGYSGVVHIVVFILTVLLLPVSLLSDDEPNTLLDVAALPATTEAALLCLAFPQTLRHWLGVCRAGLVTLDVGVRLPGGGQVVEDVQGLLVGVARHADLVVRNALLALTVVQVLAGSLLVVQTVRAGAGGVAGSFVSDHNDHRHDDDEGEDDNADDADNDVHDDQVGLSWSPHWIKQSLPERSVATPPRLPPYQLRSGHVGGHEVGDLPYVALRVHGYEDVEDLLVEVVDPHSVLLWLAGVFAS